MKETLKELRYKHMFAVATNNTTQEITLPDGDLEKLINDVLENYKFGKKCLAYAALFYGMNNNTKCYSANEIAKMYNITEGGVMQTIRSFDRNFRIYLYDFLRKS